VAKEHLIACQSTFSGSGNRAISAKNGHNVLEHHLLKVKLFPFYIPGYRGPNFSMQ
jgi:hypothetical protein